MKYLYLEKYYKRHFINTLSSQFIYGQWKEIDQLVNLRCQVFVQGTTSTHFLYLSLLTKDIAVFKEYFSKTKFKVLRQNRNKYTKQQKIVMSYVKLSHLALWKFIAIKLYSIIRSQPISEWTAFKFTLSELILTLWDMPLEYEMTKLLSEQQYIERFPIHIDLSINNVSLFNKLYILKALKLVNLPTKFNGLN